MRRVSAFTECVSRLDAFAFASAFAFAASRTDPPSERRGAPHIAASSHERQDRRGAEGATDDARASRRAKTARRAIATSDKASTIRSRRARARPRATTRARTTRARRGRRRTVDGALELDRTTDETRARRRGAARQFFQSQKGFVHLKRGGVDRVTSVLIPVGAVCVMSAMLAKGARNVKARPVDARRRRDGSASVGGFEDATDGRAGRDGETDETTDRRAIDRRHDGSHHGLE